MADLTDPRVVFELERQACKVLEGSDPRTYSAQAEDLPAYHTRLLALMEAELGDDPSDAEQAVHDAQARKVGEMAHFKEAAGISTRSTAIWAN